MQHRRIPIRVAGAAVHGPTTFPITRPDGGAPIAEVTLAGADHIEQAVAAAHSVAKHFAGLPAHQRADALAHVARRLGEVREELAGRGHRR